MAVAFYMKGMKKMTGPKRRKNEKKNANWNMYLRICGL